MSMSRGKSMCLNSSIDSLSDDLLSEILLLLPTDFLYERARLVCRKWYNIIRSVDFIETQARRSTYGLLIAPFSSYIRIHPIHVTATGRGGRIQTTKLCYKCRGTISACCNGLALECFDKDGGVALQLVNPTTSQPPFLLPPFSRHNRTCYVEACCIAYSKASMEYKVALPYLLHDHDQSRRLSRQERLGLRILSVGVDESWREVEVGHVPGHVRELLQRPPKTTEGFIHWTLRRYVLTLNVETETLSYSQVPREEGDERYSSYYYLSSQKCLSLFAGDRDFSCQIWEMKPETGEWRQLMPPKIDMRPLESVYLTLPSGMMRFIIPFGWVRYAEVLAFSVGGGYCIFYNLDTREINTTWVKFPGPYCQGVSHMNTLMWLR